MTLGHHKLGNSGYIVQSWLTCTASCSPYKEVQYLEQVMIHHLQQTGLTGFTSEFENLIGQFPGHSTSHMYSILAPHTVPFLPKPLETFRNGSSQQSGRLAGKTPLQRAENSDIITRKRGYLVQNFALKLRSLPRLKKIVGECVYVLNI